MKLMETIEKMIKIGLVVVVGLVVFVLGCEPEVKAPEASGGGDKVVAAAPSAPAGPVAFVGTFDPCLFRDKEITDRVVMKERPECGECHMTAKLTGNRLDMVIDRGKRVYNWSIDGKAEGKEIVFAKGKLRIVLKDNKLVGKYTGDMHAEIKLSPVVSEKVEK
ncbi:MAG: hypothetical protein HN350_15375 [Phycisphaerales bacterium]|mgnify:CR=1 FL=1|jgi:hypothetical protein|nr:hypothetical protein [Phycisphaerales bacterium]